MRIILSLDDKELKKLNETGHVEVALDRSIDCKNLTGVVIQKQEEK